MTEEKDDFKLDFYITQFRKMFKRILIIFGLCTICLAFLYYKIRTRPIVQYYAASESGVLKSVVPYSQAQASNYMKAQ